MGKHGTKFHGASRQKELPALQEDQTYVGGLDRPVGRRAGHKSTDPARDDATPPRFSARTRQFKSSRASEFRVSEFPNFHILYTLIKLPSDALRISLKSDACFQFRP